VVIGPAGVPWVTDVDEAKRAPELAVLSVQAHGKEEGALPIALAALIAAHGLDDETGKLYTDFIFAAVSDKIRRALEEYMRSGNYEYQSDFARKYYGEGKVEGEAKGKAEGEAKGEARALLKIFARRGLQVTDTQRAQILATTDLPTLDRWIDRALDATVAADVFE
jgi:predicted transposase YdaD